MLEAIMQTRREPDTLDRLFSALAAAGVFGQGGDLQGFLQSQRARREGLTPQQEFLASRLLMQESQDPSELQELMTMAMLDPTLRLQEGRISLSQAKLQQLLAEALFNQAQAQAVQDALEQARANRNANQ